MQLGCRKETNKQQQQQPKQACLLVRGSSGPMTLTIGANSSSNASNWQHQCPCRLQGSQNLWCMTAVCMHQGLCMRAHTHRHWCASTQASPAGGSSQRPNRILRRCARCLVLQVK
jgi:hypothetical protein